MADLYVGGPGTGVWTGAYSTLQAALAVAVGGDLIHVAQGHAQTQATSLTLTSAGTAANPVVIVCENTTTGEYVPFGASVTVTGSSSMTIAGSLDVYGLNFNTGTGAVNVTWTACNTAQDFQRFTDCNINIPASGTTARTNAGPSTNSATRLWVLRNCNLSIANASSASSGCISLSTARLEMYGGSVVAANAANLVAPNPGLGRATIALFVGVDLSGLKSDVTLVDSDSDAAVQVEFIECKLPSGWSGDLVSPTLQVGEGATMWNSDSGASNFRMRRRQYAGRCYSNSGVYRDASGTGDGGATRYSWHIEAETPAKRNGVHVETPWMMAWNDETGVSKTVTVEIASAATKTTAEVWLEVRYLGASGAPLSTVLRTGVSNPLAAASNHTTSSEAWTGSGTSVKQKLSATFTPQMKGLVLARVCAAASLFVDPDPVLS